MKIQVNGCLIPTLAAAQIVLLVLKLTDAVECSWAIALIPLMIIGGIYFIYLIIFLVTIWIATRH